MVMEADARLFNRLRDFIPRDALGATSRALVINCAGGVQGTGRLCQVPNLCEMIGVPYTGPDPLAMAVISDHQLLAQTLSAHGIRTLEFQESLDQPESQYRDEADLLVLHRFQSDRERIPARDTATLTRAVKRIQAAGDQPLIARAPAGRTLRVIVIRGNEANAIPQALPAIEDRRGKRGFEVARLNHTQRHALETAAQRAFIRTALPGYPEYRILA